MTYPPELTIVREWLRDPDKWARESTATCVLDERLRKIAAEQLRAIIAAAYRQAAYDAFRMLVCAPDALPTEHHALVEYWFMEEASKLQARILAMAEPG